jgi:hypothetical protein
MNLGSLVPRRPSASMVISCIALFVALGGVGYAATQLPPGSVGNAQLQNGSVGNWKLKSGAVGARKIINGSVGAKEVNSGQVQLRVANNCSSNTAIQAVGLPGTVTCTPTLPNEYGTTSSATTLGSGSTQIVTESLPANSSYLVLADPQATITGGSSAQRVEVDCTLSVPGGATTTSTLAVIASTTNSQVGTIPLTLPVPLATSAQTATVACTDSATGPSPTVSVASTVNAIQTASNS